MPKSMARGMFQYRSKHEQQRAEREETEMTDAKFGKFITVVVICASSCAFTYVMVVIAMSTAYSFGMDGKPVGIVTATIASQILPLWVLITDPRQNPAGVAP